MVMKLDGEMPKREVLISKLAKKLAKEGSASVLYVLASMSVQVRLRDNRFTNALESVVRNHSSWPRACLMPLVTLGIHEPNARAYMCHVV